MKKVVFAQLLRGIAAFVVAFNHIVAIFYNDVNNVRNMIHDVSFSYKGTNDNFLFEVMTLFFQYTKISLGLFGVSVFFLISGFVIPFSLERRNSLHFMENRLMRIIPTIAFTLGICCVALSICHALIPTNTYEFSFWTYLSNILLFRPFVGHQFIDGVTWTLEIEMLFYIAMAVSSYLMDIKKPNNILIIAVSVAIISLLFRNSTSMGGKFLNHSSYWLIFMLFGTCFYNLFRKNWTIKTFFVTIFGMWIIWMCEKNYISNPSQHGSFSMMIALLVFSVMYYFKDKIKETKFINFWADISYPLYASHQIVGYILLAYCITYTNIPVIYASLLIFFLMIFYAWLVHKYIEKPTQILSKKF